MGPKNITTNICRIQEYSSRMGVCISNGFIDFMVKDKS